MPFDLIIEFLLEHDNIRTACKIGLAVWVGWYFAVGRHQEANYGQQPTDQEIKSNQQPTDQEPNYGQQPTDQEPNYGQQPTDQPFHESSDSGDVEPDWVFDAG